MAMTKDINNNEKCPLRDCQIISRMFDYDGGEIIIKEHAVKVTVPNGAIGKGYRVQIEVAASLFGPFIIPEGYHPISPYVWIGNCYEFKKNIEIEIEHDIVISTKGNISEWCMLTACEKDTYHGKNGQKLYQMHKDTNEYQYKISDSTITFFTDHLCSKCLTVDENIPVAKRVMMYHYLPENYKSKHEFVSEVCFCYDLKFCKEVINLLATYT